MAAVVVVSGLAAGTMAVHRMAVPRTLERLDQHHGVELPRDRGSCGFIGVS
jgi:hypothetical protein